MRSATFVVVSATSRPVGSDGFGSDGFGSGVVGAPRFADVVAPLVVVVRRDAFDESPPLHAASAVAPVSASRRPSTVEIARGDEVGAPGCTAPDAIQPGPRA